MDYFDDAFGGFDPQKDPDAAVKFSLNAVLMDGRFRDLSWVLTDGHEVGAIEGEPGWIIERRDSGLSRDMPGYSTWPPNAAFHAQVDPEFYVLAHPDCFMDAASFFNCVRKALNAYVMRNPENGEEARRILVTMHV